MYNFIAILEYIVLEISTFIFLKIFVAFHIVVFFMVELLHVFGFFDQIVLSQSDPK